MIIRRLPTDFLVEEILTDTYLADGGSAPSSERRWAVYRLEKTSLTTPEAVGRLARALGIASARVAYAGLKDKHAQTVQHVTVESDDADVLPEGADGGGWSARRIGWTSGAIQAAAISRNRFELTIRGMAGGDASLLERRARWLGDGAPDRLLVVNYFGEQRFGSARHGGGFAGAHLVKGEFEQALRLLIATPARKDTGMRRQFVRAAAECWGDWTAVLAKAPACAERGAIEVLEAGGEFRDAFAALPNFDQVMAVEAFQSFLWNATARRMVETLGVAAGRVEDDYGGMLFPAGANVPETWRTLEVPMLGPQTRLEEPWSGPAAATLAEWGIEAAMLRVPGLRRPVFGEAWRPLVAEARGFALRPPEPDETTGGKKWKRRVHFDLPRGAYATVVLRALGQ